MISTRKYRCEKFLREGTVEKRLTRRFSDFHAAREALHRMLDKVQNVTDERCRITCLATGEEIEWRLEWEGGSKKWKVIKDTFVPFP